MIVLRESAFIHKWVFKDGPRGGGDLRDLEVSDCPSATMHNLIIYPDQDVI